jgi:midasin (ATPase involved in ribosome maturation)
MFQNLSQQSDISDLLGGFKPTDARSICFPLYMEFKDLFCRSFSGKVCPVRSHYVLSNTKTCLTKLKNHVLSLIQITVYSEAWAIFSLEFEI